MSTGLQAICTVPLGQHFPERLWPKIKRGAQVSHPLIRKGLVVAREGETCLVGHSGGMRSAIRASSLRVA